MVPPTQHGPISLSKESELDLKEHLRTLTRPLSVSQNSDAADVLHARIHAGHCVRQFLIETTDTSRHSDQFRLEDGFEALLEAFETLAKVDEQFFSASGNGKSILDYSQVLFSILSDALFEHRGNQRFFQNRIDGDGWQRLKISLLQLLSSKAVNQHVGREKLAKRLFGSLLACALNDETITPVFSKLEVPTEVSEDTNRTDDDHRETVPMNDRTIGNSPSKALTFEIDTRIQAILRGALGTLAFVHNPEPIVILLQLWKTSQDNDTGVERAEPPACSMVPDTIRYVGELSTHNLAALHSSDLLSTTLSYLTSSSLNQSQITKLRNLTLLLLRMGVSNLGNARFLYTKAVSSELIAGVLLVALEISRTPPFVHFDLSIHGFSSIELPGIGKDFPPPSPSAGYTLSLWLHVVKFDSSSHTTLFGAYESTQACFVLVYLEKDSRNLILQTSVTSSRPSVRFKSTTFEENRWYHVVIVHRKPRTTMSSRASLFVDGDFVEQVRSSYPGAPPSSGHSIDGTGLGRTSKSIQAFFGTPQDLASRLGKGLVSSQWRLASAHLFGEALTDDLIAVHYQLGPRYHGNYQDCLGSFQTYRASAALNIRNETLHPGKEEKSDIVSAIRHKASALLPENRVILNISPSVILDDDDQNNIDEKQLLKGLGRQASKNLRNVTRGGRNALAINGSIPSINEALQYPSGFAVLTGDPAVVVPHSLDDASWGIGGCAAVGLALIDAADTPENILVSLDILFESIKDNWRNSEAMERENGFGVLATLLTNKLDPTKSKVSNQTSPGTDSEALQQREMCLWKVLSTILKFVGYHSDQPRDSVINNPLAYRVLLVDVDIWRNAAPAVQRLYYKQFVDFGIDSKYHYFNAKRLSKMRITKKWLEALKIDRFTSHTIDYFLEAFKTVLTPQPSAESLRSLAMYITYARQSSRKRDSSPFKASRSASIKAETTPRRQTLVTDSPGLVTPHSNPSTDLTQSQLAIRVMEMYAAFLCNTVDTATIKKFAKTVTNRWLLFLLADDEPKIVVLAAQILARLLVINGPSYVQKFVVKTAGISIMQHRVKRWWRISTIWLICFAVLFGQDVANVNMERPFDLYNLLESFNTSGQARVVYPEIFPVVTAMLQAGLRAITQDEIDPDSPSTDKKNIPPLPLDHNVQLPKVHKRSPSMSVRTEITRLDTSQSREQRVLDAVAILHTVTRFLADIHSKSQLFRDFAVGSSYVQELLSVLFPIIVSSDAVSPETEFHSRDAALTFHGEDVAIRPLSQTPLNTPTFIRTASPQRTQSLRPTRVQAPRRMSSYVFVTPEGTQRSLSLLKLQAGAPKKGGTRIASNAKNTTVEEILEILIAVFADQLFHRKDFPGLGLFMKVPPGFQEHQAYFETFMLQNTLSSLGNTIRLNQKLLWEPRVLTNLARFAKHLSEAVYEGWFINGVEPSLDFLGSILEYLQLPDIANIKSVRLCNQTIATMRSVLLRIVLLRLSELDELAQSSETVSFLEKLVYWQTVILVAQDGQDYYLRLLCYLLYHRLVSPEQSVRVAAANLWRMLLIQRHHYGSDLLHEALGRQRNDSLSGGFAKIMEVDNETFLDWIDSHRDELDNIFSSTLEKLWTDFVAEENKCNQENSEARVNKRKERLKVWQTEHAATNEALRRHEVSADHWRSNIYTSEHLKRQRALQDQQDNLSFNISTWAKMNQELRRPCGVFDCSPELRWQLDQTEGRNRMRKRLIPDMNAHLLNIKPKRKQSEVPTRHRGKSLEIHPEVPSKKRTPDPRPLQIPPDVVNVQNGSKLGAVTPPEPVEGPMEQDEGFEIVDDPTEGYEEYEDKNRKVMRSLERGDQVEHVLNVSRIIGLEACEGLLILGKIHLYLLDNFFQRSDGEIVNVWQAPQLERDPYVQMISGKEAGERRASSISTAHEARSWRWEDVLSISKRRFLFRDVAIEVFFVDGRSYLLTCGTASLRNELYQRLQDKACNTAERASSGDQEDLWRIESVRNPEDETRTFGSKFTSVFAQTHSHPATRKWMKGEISNFHYLMVINTMAGRTFNDLTQYPVFPWVLADYTSEELDLSDPKTFRDLTKPMGCQTPERQADFRERYLTFAEMNEGSPSFHYGTHYSSAMIVTSYLIRLQPFVQSYLLLQGGNFDHPDRLFYSIEKAWSSASRENMTDVRELIPEFYYLPEFLLNSNGYDFGLRQGDGGAVDTVVLPPWARGDPNIFIAKHREALESEYVSKNLHHWIDLVFGHKQQGDAALEATNVFHHLSYHGAKDLDSIDDPLERLATIGIIHNFGQTPYQIFQRQHPAREDVKNRAQRLDTAIESLTQSNERVSSLQYSSKHDRILCSSFFRLTIAPTFDKYMEWGFVDGSIRFYLADSKKLIGLFEHVHQRQVAYAAFADSKTLVTAGMDCTVSVWALTSAGRAVDLQPKACLFGHKASITTLAVSRSFSALLSASSDGQVLLWDLNRLKLVRVLATGSTVECACINDVTGTIVLCRGRTVSLFTLNGDSILDQDVCQQPEDTITACAFYEGSGQEYLERNLVFTGHKWGLVNAWNCTIKGGVFVLELLKRMDHLDQAGFNIHVAMTAILPMAQAVYTGDEDGKVYEWDCIQRQ